MAQNRFPLIAVFGPTGAAKSQLALHLAKEFAAEIVNFDSVQVYRGLDIGTAKLPPPGRLGIPHHLIDILDPDGQLSAGEYARLARETLEDLRNRETLPVLIGGTGFYLRALLDGLSPAAPRDTAIRERLSAIRKKNPAVLHRFLRRYDPPAAARIHPNDHQKLIRALELILLERRPASQTQAQPRTHLEGFSILKLGLSPPRADLYRRINDRTQRMFASGLIEETAALLTRFPPDLKPLQSLGYKQAIDVLQGRSSLEKAITECQTKTRQYAKRQITWFRRERDTHWLYGFGDDPETQKQALSICRANSTDDDG